MTNVYIYNADRYGNNGDFATTFEELQGMINELAARCGVEPAELYETTDGIEDEEGQIAFLATPENLAKYDEEIYNGIAGILDPNELLK